MIDREPERSFREFLRTGDPVALGKVFDAAAPKLLLVAVHLVGDGSAAEDLVQATFLAVIEKAGSFDPDRRVLPWLVGILTNEARMMQRQRRRSIDPQRRGLPRVETPIEAAESREFSERFARALEALPSHYQQVLNLRLVHGLGPVQIAHSIGCAPGTVKSRLRRGIEILRAALPAGFALSTAVLLTPSRGLGAVRAHVVDTAAKRAPPSIPAEPTPAAGATATAEPAAGTLSPHASVLGLAALCCAVLGAIWGASWFLGGHESPASQASHVDGTSSGESRESRHGPSRREEPSRRPVLASGRRGEEQPTSVIEGRCIDGATRAPIAGCTVRLDGIWRRWSRDFWKTPIPWQRPAPLLTDAEGRFRFEFVPPQPFLLHLEIAAPQRRRVLCTFNSLNGGKHENLGDIELARLAPVRGTVVDERGVGVAGVEVTVGDRETGVSDRGSGRVHWLPPEPMRTAVDGSFAGIGVARPGMRAVRISQEVRLLHPSRVDVGAAGTELHVVVQRMPSIRGRVVDPGGVAIGGVAVTAESATQSCTAQSERDGTFRIFARKLPPRGETVTVRSRSDMCVPGDGERVATWNGPELTIVRRQLGQVEVQALVAATEEPVQFYSIVCRPLDRRFAAAGLDYIRAVCIRPDGRWIVDKVYPGKNEMIVLPEDDRLASQRIVFDSGAPRVQVRVERRDTVTVCLRSPAGEPVRGLTVRFRRLQGASTDLHRDAFQVFAPVYRDQEAPRTVAGLVSRARSNHRGVARLGAPRDLPVCLEVVGASRGVLLRRTMRSLPGGALNLTVPLDAAATLAGTMTLDGAVPAGARVSFAYVTAGEPKVRGWTAAVPLGADGEFRLEQLPAGSFLPQLEYRDREAGRVLRISGEHWFDAGAGTALDRTFRIVRRALRIRVADSGGTAAAETSVRLTCPWPDGGPGYVVLSKERLRTGANGELEIDPAPMGRFRLRGALNDAPTRFVERSRRAEVEVRFEKGN